MEIKLNLDDFQPHITRATCPKCKAVVDATILNEYDIYTELYHPECGEEWRFISYSQCKKLQKTKYDKLAYEVNYGSDARNMRLIGKIMIGVNGFILTAATAGYGLVPAVFFGNEAYKHLKKSQFEDALHESYDIHEFFTGYRKYQLDEKFKEEQLPHLAEVSKNKYSHRSSTGFF